MGLGMLAAGALTGGANAMGQMADDAIKQRERVEVRQQSIMDRRNELLFEMKVKSDIARQEEEASQAAGEHKRMGKQTAIGGRMNANAEEALGVRYGEPAMGDTPLSPAQQRALDDGLRRQRIDKEKDKARYMRDPENMVRAAVQEGYESPVALLQNDTKQQLAQVRADGDASKRAQAVELALAKLDANGHNKPPAGYREAPDGNLMAIPGGPADPAVKEVNTKPMPASAARSMLENQSNLRRAGQALALLEGKELPGGAKGDTAATGWKSLLPNQILNRADPAGVDTRAAIADLGSMVIHDRSGAAVTASEFPRLAPFIPSATDDAATARKKLSQFLQSYTAILDDQADFYRELGYRVPSEVLRSGTSPEGAKPPAPATGAPMVRSKAELDALPSGTAFKAPDGSIRRKP